MSMTAPSVFDCFCGFGGLSLGAELAGMKIIGGIDSDRSAIDVYAKCFPNAKSLHNDLLKDSPRRILARSCIRRGDIEVLVGGPPCQPYSINNHNRSTSDSRCVLVQRYLEFVSELRPTWLVMENVPAFASIGDGSFLKTLLNSLRRRRYFSAFGIINAIHFGVPQRRNRLILIACRDQGKVANAMKEILTRKEPLVTVGEALGDLPEETSSAASYKFGAIGRFQKMMRRNVGNAIQSHISPALGATNLKRIQHVPAGGNWRSIPRKLLPPGMLRAKLTDHTTRYGRLNSSKPAFTLLTKCDPHWGCFVHPTQDRVISVREAARLQSIPDRVQFLDSLTASYRQIGNAVPPLLAKGILEIIR